MSGEAQNTQQQTTETEKQNAAYEKIKQEINELNDNDKSNDKVQLEGILTTEFAEKLDQPTASTLLTEAKAAKAAKEEKQETYTELDDLIAFLELKVKPHQVNGTLDITEGENQNSVITKFDDYFNVNDGSLKDISLLPKESQNAIENIKKILKNPTKENIQQLQDFLYNNLLDKEKDTFKNSNRKSNNRDGSFGDSTKNALKNFLDQTVKYTESYKKHSNIIKEGDEQQKIINTISTSITNLDINISTKENITDVYKKYIKLNENMRNQINNKEKLEELNSICINLEQKFNNNKDNFIGILSNEKTTSNQKTYELSKAIMEIFSSDEIKILSNEITTLNETDINNAISFVQKYYTTSNENVANQIYTTLQANRNTIKSAFNIALNGNNVGQERPDNTQENIQAQIEQNTKASKSFDEISEDLKKIGDAKIKTILTQIAPLNEKLKQGHSIAYLETEKTRLENAIKNFGGEDTSFKENGKIESGLDKGEKKGFRKEIRDLEKQLMDVCKELEDKQKIKDKIYKNESNTESGMITEIKNIISDNSNNDYYKGAIDSYIANLDNMGQDVEDKQNNTKEGEKATNEKGNPVIEHGKTAANHAPRNKQNINDRLKNLGINRRPEDGFWKNVGNVFGAILGGLFGFSIKGKESIVGIIKPDQINLENFESGSEIRTTLEAINNETKAFNGRKEIVTAINETNNNKKEQQIKNLQRKLRTFPTGQGDNEGKSPINITGTIDKPTAEALRAYAQKAQNNTNQKNDNAMPYAFCEGYTPIDISKYNTQQDKQYEAYTTNDNKTTILITKDSDGNIMSIKKGKYCEANGQNDWDFPKMNGQKYSLDKENNTIIKNGFNDLQS